MSKYRPRPKSDDESGGTDEWLLTYGDLVTQMLCFFILLMSFSSISSNKFREVMVSLNAALSGTGVLPAWNSVMEDIPRTPIEIQEALDKLKAGLDKQIEKGNLSEYVETEMRETGLAIILKQKEPSIFFDSADARVKEEAYPILDQIGQVIKGIPNNIRIEGHTDNRPINTLQFPSNWELSTMRATNVLRYLLANAKITPSRLSAAGYGEYKPIASNDAEAGMSKNRRVEIIILRENSQQDKDDKQNPSPATMGSEDILPTNSYTQPNINSTENH